MCHFKRGSGLCLVLLRGTGVKGVKALSPGHLTKRKKKNLKDLYSERIVVITECAILRMIL